MLPFLFCHFYIQDENVEHMYLEQANIFIYQDLVIKNLMIHKYFYKVKVHVVNCVYKYFIQGVEFCHYIGGIMLHIIGVLQRF